MHNPLRAATLLTFAVGALVVSGTNSLLVTPAQAGGVFEAFKLHPEKQARRRAEGFSDSISPPPKLSSYRLANSTAVRVAAAELVQHAKLVELSDNQVATDWVYTTTSGIGERGDYLVQRRERYIARVTPGSLPGVVEVRLTHISERRRLEAERPEPSWTPVAPADAGFHDRLHDALARRHESDLLRATVTAPAMVIAAARAAIPDNFAEVQNSPASFTAQRVTREVFAKRDIRCTWERIDELIVEMIGNSAAPNLRVSAKSRERFIVDDQPSHWEQPAAHEVALAHALREQIIQRSAAVTLPHPEIGQAPALVELSGPPAAPALRTRAEILAQAEAEAVASHTGSFTISVERVEVAQRTPRGNTWDQELIGGLYELQASAFRFLAQARGLGDTTDGIVAQFEQLPQKTGVTDPDLFGLVTVGQARIQLPMAKTLAATYNNATARVNFRNDGPPINIDLADAEPSGHSPDVIGQCSVRLSELTAADGRLTLPCGSATVTLSARFQYVGP